MFNKIVTYHDGITYENHEGFLKALSFMKNILPKVKERNLQTRVSEMPGIILIEYAGRKIDVIKFYLIDCQRYYRENLSMRIKTVLKILRK